MSKDCKVKTYKHVKYAEIGVIVFEAFLLIGLSIPLYSQLKTTLPTDDDILEIDSDTHLRMRGLQGSQ